MPAYASQHIQHMLRYVGIWQHMLAFVGICQHVPCQHMLADFGICSHMPECRRICNRVLTYADYVGMDYHIYQHMPRHANNCQRMLADARICKYGLVAYPNKGPHSLKPAFFLCAVHARFMRGLPDKLCQHMLVYVRKWLHFVSCVSICQHMIRHLLEYARICWYMLGYASTCCGSICQQIFGICQQIFACGRVCNHMLIYASLRQHMQTDLAYAGSSFWQHMLAYMLSCCRVCSHMPTCASLRQHMPAHLAYAKICQHLAANLRYEGVCEHVLWSDMLAHKGIGLHMLACGRVCNHMLMQTSLCQHHLAHARLQKHMAAYASIC